MWREGQAAGRASDRLKVDVALDEGRARRAPRRRRRARGRAAHACATPCAGFPVQREAVVLAYWGGLTADQIARRSNVPLGTAKSRIRLGLAQAAPRLRGAPSPGAARRPACSLRRAVPVNASQFDPRLLPVFLDGRERAGRRPTGSTPTPTSARTTPTGARPPPRRSSAASTPPATSRALLFAMHEPDGYPAANDAVLAAAAASDGRLVALARIAPNADGRARRGAALPGGRRARVQAAPALGRLRPAASGRRGGRRAGPRAPRAGALPRRARDPAPRRGRGRPRAPLPGRAADPGPRRHQRPRLDRRRGGRAATTCSSTPPGGTSPTSCSSTRRSRPGGSSTPATCPTRPGCWPPSSSCACARAVGHGPEVAALDRRRAARARRGRGGARSTLGPGARARRRGPARDRGRARRHLLRGRAAGRLPRHGPRRADRAGAAGVPHLPRRRRPRAAELRRRAAGHRPGERRRRTPTCPSRSCRRRCWRWSSRARRRPGCRPSLCDARHRSRRKTGYGHELLFVPPSGLHVRGTERGRVGARRRHSDGHRSPRSMPCARRRLTARRNRPRMRPHLNLRARHAATALGALCLAISLVRAAGHGAVR